MNLLDGSTPSTNRNAAMTVFSHASNDNSAGRLLLGSGRSYSKIRDAHQRLFASSAAYTYVYVQYSKTGTHIHTNSLSLTKEYLWLLHASYSSRTPGKGIHSIILIDIPETSHTRISSRGRLCRTIYHIPFHIPSSIFYTAAWNILAWRHNKFFLLFLVLLVLRFLLCPPSRSKPEGSGGVESSSRFLP